MGLTRQGKRIERKKALKGVKVHKKEFYKKLTELEYISAFFNSQGTRLTEDNIEDEVSTVSEIKLGALEKMILLNNQRKYDEQKED